MKSQEIFIEIDDKLGIATDYIKLGVIQFEDSKYKEAIESYEIALKISEELGNQETIVLGYLNLGKWFQKTPDDVQLQLGYDPALKFAKSEECLLKCLKISEEVNILKE